MTELIGELQVRLEAHSLDQKRRWWEQYLKGQAAFRGVPMASVRSCVHEWFGEYHLDFVLTQDERLDLAGHLVAQRFTEDKLAGILLLTEKIIPEGDVDWDAALIRFARYFDDGLLADWNVVDWFCVKALWALVDSQGETCGRAVMGWADAENLWRARASVVTFANVASKGERVFPGFGERLLESCATLIVRPERFAKTGVGWVLRGLADSEPEAVHRFAERHLLDFSTEALRNAVKRMSPDVAGSLISAHKNAATRY
jgi:3-methyladenine DNA glycosylase AlkD